METTGKLTGASRTFDGHGIILTFEVDASSAGQIENMKKDDLLRIRAVKYKQKRSLDANAYASGILWVRAESVLRGGRTMGRLIDADIDI